MTEGRDRGSDIGKRQQKIWQVRDRRDDIQDERRKRRDRGEK
jgi:hypothetical protein